MSDYGNLMTAHEALKTEHARVCAERDDLRQNLALYNGAALSVPLLAATADISTLYQAQPWMAVTVDHDAIHQAETDRVIAESNPDA